MKKVIEERKDIVFYVKMYPLPMHKGADEKAKAIICEKSIKLLEDSFEGKDIPKAKCDTKAVEENIKLAQKLGINGTPALILSDGRVVSGYKDAKAITALVEN